MKSFKRRTFLFRSAAAIAGIGLLSRISGEAANEKATGRANRLAVSTYSFWRFKKDLKLPIETCIDEAAAMGFDGV